MFRYKICFYCKSLYKSSLFLCIFDIFIIYIASSTFLHLGIFIIAALIQLSIPIIFIRSHYKEHQKIQFNKIINKFK